MKTFPFLFFYIFSLTQAGRLPDRRVLALDERIVGGMNAGEGVAPYSVSLRTSNEKHFCGGGILNTRWIITAAHCVLTLNPKTILVGTNIVNKGGEKYNVSEIIVHANYNNTTQLNDIALVKVSTPIVYRDTVQPVAVATDFIRGNASAVLTGWGRLSHPGVAAIEMQIISMKTMEVADCRGRLKALNNIYTSQICTIAQVGHGACHGDSGGPLVLNSKLIGIVSWGYPCAKGYPDVFTRVQSYIPWIRNKIN